MDSVSKRGITLPNESGHLFGKSTNRNTNKKESVPAWASTLKPPVSMDTSLDTDTLDTGICCYSRCYIVALQHLLLSTGPSTSAVNQLKTALFAVNLSVKHRL